MLLSILLLACGPTPSTPEPVPVPSTPPEAPTPTSGTVGSQPVNGTAGEPGVGRWNLARSSDVSEEIAQLEAIGYVGGEEAGTGKADVVLHEEGAFDGVNLYVSGHAAEATLLSMDGEVLHRWAKPFRDIWPDRRVKKKAQGPNFWRRAMLLPGGELLAIYEGHGLVKLDRDSNVLWAWDGRAHHDLEVLEDGRIWVLSRKGHVVPELHEQRPVLEDFATLLSPDGEVLKEISILRAVLGSPARVDTMKRIPRRFGDIFHTNSLEVLDGRVPDPRFAEGNLLLSMRATSMVMVLDPDAERIVWWHYGDYSKQHDPTVLPNGNLLLFDNLGPGDGASAVREYTLPDMEPVWTYAGSEEGPFFSRFCGASQRLPNGNTLVSESGIGRVFEVDPSGRRVWEFDNPARAGEGGKFVAIVPELVRLPASITKGWLEAGAGTP